MRKKNRGLLFLMVVLLALTGYAIYQVDQVGNTLQYIVPAPAPVYQSDNNDGDDAKKIPPNQAIKDALKQLDATAESLQNIVSSYTLSGILEQSGLSGNASSTTARLNCLGPDAFSVSPEFLSSGRLFYPEELEEGKRVILLDEQLALTLFKISDSVGKKVNLFGYEYQVVGTIRHEKQVGDYKEFAAYIPLMQVVEESVQLDALMVTALPIPGTGAPVAFKVSMTESWIDGDGTLYDLGKEGVGATLWLRVLAFLTGAIFLLKGIGWLNQHVMAFIHKYQIRLKREYAVRLLPWLIGMCLLFALGYGLLAGLAALLMNFIIEPVYTFPEWIPAVLVEWKDIQTAFWNVWQSSAMLKELRTPEILRLRFLGFVIQWCAALMGAAMITLFHRIPKKKVSE